MVNEKSSPKLYLALSLVLLSFLYALNSINKIYLCALIFTLIMVVSNIITYFYGRKRTILASLFVCICTYVLFLNSSYYLNGKVVNGIITASLTSVFICTLIGSRVFVRAPENYNFNLRNSISLILAVVVDGVIMASFFITKYSVSRVMNIFYKELIYKLLYTTTVFACIYLASRGVYFIKWYRFNKSFRA